MWFVLSACAYNQALLACYTETMASEVSCMQQDLMVLMCALSSLGKANTDITSTTGKQCVH